MVNLATGLKLRGYDIDFFVYYPDKNHFKDQLTQLLIPIYSTAKKDKLGVNVIAGLRKLVISQKYDVVLSFLDTPNFYSEVASLGVSSKLIVSERRMYPPGRLSNSLYLLQQSHRLADHITVNSHHQRERMLREFPWMDRKITTIYNGLDLSVFAPSTEAHVVDPANRRLLAIGSISRHKNACNLVRAMNVFKETYGWAPHISWVGTRLISGEGVATYDEASRLLQDYGLTQSWEWLGERHDVPALLATHDALIHPSFEEGLPNVVCEALGCGKPVLIGDVCDHSKLVQDGVSGFLFDPGSPNDISAIVAAFYDLNRDQYASMCRAARQYALNNLSLDFFVDNYEKLFLAVSG